MPKLAIILPTLNEEHYIERTLLAAKACAPDANFIVVDGGSRAGSVMLLASEVETSARRHRKWGLLRTQLTVIIIRILYLFRIHPAVYAWLWPEVR